MGDVQSHCECHQASFPQCSSETVCAGNFGRESQSPSQSPHAEVGSAIRAISDLSVSSECLYSYVELRDIHYRSFITDGGRPDILSDNRQECFSIGIGRRNLYLGEV